MFAHSECQENVKDWVKNVLLLKHDSATCVVSLFIQQPRVIDAGQFE